MRGYGIAGILLLALGPMNAQEYPVVTEEMKIQALKRAYGITDKPVVIVPTKELNEIDRAAVLKPKPAVVVDVCTRHHMRKVVRGKSWRCRR
jgi:hypothetical protein